MLKTETFNYISLDIKKKGKGYEHPGKLNDTENIFNIRRDAWSVPNLDFVV